MQPNVQRKVRFWWRYTPATGLQSQLLQISALCNMTAVLQGKYPGQVGLECGTLGFHAVYFETRLLYVAKSVFMAQVHRDWDCEHLVPGPDIMNRLVIEQLSQLRSITLVRT
jgi:hypothetical protein